MLRGAGHDTSETRTPFRCAVRALWKKDLRPDERLARVVIPRRCHRRRNGRTNGNPRVFLVNTLFWKILVTRVNRKISRVEYGGEGGGHNPAGGWWVGRAGE